MIIQSKPQLEILIEGLKVERTHTEVILKTKLKQDDVKARIELIDEMLTQAKKELADIEEAEAKDV
jgi:hypothetical protein